MNSRTLISISTIALFAALAMSAQLATQEQVTTTNGKSAASHDSDWQIDDEILHEPAPFGPAAAKTLGGDGACIPLGARCPNRFFPNGCCPGLVCAPNSGNGASCKPRPGRTWFVNGASGSNSNNCMSATTACKTIGHAISLASWNDTIMVAAATYTEHLTIGFSLTVIGSGANTTIIDGGGSGRVVTISNAAASVTLVKLTIRNGHAVYGGGINNSGTLTLNNSAVTGNVASQWGGGIYNKGALMIKQSTLKGNRASFICTPTTSVCDTNGGGIFNDSGTSMISMSTLSGNSASPSCQTGGSCVGLVGRGGGIFNFNGTLMISMSTLSGNSSHQGGGIDNRGTLTISNSTFSGNSAHQSPGNAFGGGISNGGTLTISNSTFSGNSAVGTLGSFGGGIISGGTATLQNSIAANSPSGGNCSGTMTSNGFNLSSDNTCNFNNVGDLNNTNPMLGTLGNNGGPTQTIPLLSGSPAIDTGNPSGCTDGQGNQLKTDQRGMPRPDLEDTGGCDMGAYERQSD